MPRVTTGVFRPEHPPWHRSDIVKIKMIFGERRRLDPDIKDLVRASREVYFAFASGIDNMAAKSEVESLLREWVVTLNKVVELSLSSVRGNERFEADQALRQILEGYGSARDDLFKAARRLNGLLARGIDQASFADVRKPEAVGLRAVLWMLHGPGREKEMRLGESLGLSMGSGTGRGAPRLREFLAVIAAREISADEIRYAMKFLTERKLVPRDQEKPIRQDGNRVARFAHTLTEFPEFW